MVDFWNNIPTAGLTGEGNVELRLVIPLLHALGYEDDDIESKYPVVFQQGRLGRKPEADFVCFYGLLHNRDTSLLVVEAKRPGEALPNGKEQGESYVANLRTPLLVLTNGETFEIWQWQATQESTCVLNIPVRSLAAERGTIERLLTKTAVYDYCRSFHVKTILEASAEYGRYETAELKRTSRYAAASIDRTVRRAGGDQDKPGFESIRLLIECPSGAVIVAPSGYGKTTLSCRLFRQAIEERWRGTHLLLAFDIPLTDLEQTGTSILEFMQRRLAPHCPGMTPAALEQLLREAGVTILCDGFDRTSAPFQKKLVTEFANLTRDYPRVQLFVFSREAVKPNIALPIFALEPLSDEQMREFERLVFHGDGAHFYSIIGMMPTTLRSLCNIPLLLQLTLEYWRRQNTFPVKIEFLFRSWLDSTLQTEASDHVSAIVREQALTLISTATANSSISGTQAIALFKSHDIPTTTLNELIACDAVRVNGAVVDVQHEALADYLRAKAIASTPEDELLLELSALPIPTDSFFPVLLTAQLSTRRLQTTLWKRLSHVSTRAYLDALRYRFDVSNELKQLDSAKLSESYLQELIEGIEIPLNSFFPQLRETVIENLTGDGKATIAATGLVRADPASLMYKLHARAPGGPRVTVAMPTPPGTLRGVNLDLSHYRIDSGRVLGMTLVRDTILEAIQHQQLKGGPTWAEERLIGRIRYLAERNYLKIRLTDNLAVLEDILRPHAGAWLRESALVGGERFSIQSLLDDIAILREAGRTHLDQWWLRLGWNRESASQTDDAICRVLEEDFRRMQMVYAEIVQNTFPTVAKELSFFTTLPIRGRFYVVHRVGEIPGSSLYYQWLPATSWGEAGAEVTIADRNQAQRMLLDSSDADSGIYRAGSMMLLPTFDGIQWNGHFDGATTVTHEVCSLLTDDLKGLFEALPSSDSKY
jgi:hypothetical protein